MTYKIMVNLSILKTEININYLFEHIISNKKDDAARRNPKAKVLAKHFGF